MSFLLPHATLCLLHLIGHTEAHNYSNLYGARRVTKTDREKKYSEEIFWLRTINLRMRENFTEDKFTNLFEVQSAIQKIYNLALENNLGQDVIAEWQQHVIVVQSLLDSLGSKSHKTALKDLKKIFGGNRGLNEGNKKLVDSILRNS